MFKMSSYLIQEYLFDLSIFIDENSVKNTSQSSLRAHLAAPAIS